MRHNVALTADEECGTMEIIRRAKRYLSWDEYWSLDKRNREVVVEQGEVARVPTHDLEGRELPDPVPMAPPVGFVQNPSMFDVMRDMIRGEQLRAYAELQGSETWEEAQDFDMEDTEFPRSPYEGDFDPMVDLQAQREKAFRQRFIEEETNASYREWRDRVLREQEQQGSALSRMARDEAREPRSELREREAPKGRGRRSPRPEPASDEE